MQKIIQMQLQSMQENMDERFRVRQMGSSSKDLKPILSHMSQNNNSDFEQITGR
jgi:hypothetical protein